LISQHEKRGQLELGIRIFGIQLCDICISAVGLLGITELKTGFGKFEVCFGIFGINLNGIFELQPGTFELALFKKIFAFFKMNPLLLLIGCTAGNDAQPAITIAAIRKRKRKYFNRYIYILRLFF
jgi:hypothetical protein